MFMLQRNRDVGADSQAGVFKLTLFGRNHTHRLKNFPFPAEMV
jgi:hypothetical protein